MCSTTHLSIFGGIIKVALKLGSSHQIGRNHQSTKSQLRNAFHDFMRDSLTHSAEVNYLMYSQYLIYYQYSYKFETQTVAWAERFPVKWLTSPIQCSICTPQHSLRRNVVVALRCSTFSSLMDAAAFKKLMKPEWLQQPATIVTLLFLMVACA